MAENEVSVIGFFGSKLLDMLKSGNVSVDFDGKNKKVEVSANKEDQKFTIKIDNKKTKE